MILLLSSLWPGLAGAFALGLGVGWLCGLPRGAIVPVVLTLTASALWGTALSGIVPGRPGLWVESAALMLPAYVAGCLMAAFGRQLFREKRNTAPA